MARLRLARAAQNDLRAIRAYSKASFGAAVTLEYLDGLRSTFKFLGEHPLAGPSEADLGDGIRSFSHRAHRIYYRVEGGAVLIVRIFHNAQDARAVLGADR